MLSLQADFMRLDKIPVAELFEAVGTYVLWDSQARARPSYIGEGDLLRRLSDHSVKFAMPLNGYVAVLGDPSRKYFKTDSELVEAVLLEVSKRIGRYPLHNRQQGSSTAINKTFQSNRVVKIYISGFDPFESPTRAKRFRRKHTIRLSTAKGNILIDHPWDESDEWLRRFA